VAVHLKRGRVVLSCKIGPKCEASSTGQHVAEMPIARCSVARQARARALINRHRPRPGPTTGNPSLDILIGCKLAETMRWSGTRCNSNLRGSVEREGSVRLPWKERRSKTETLSALQRRLPCTVCPLLTSQNFARETHSPTRQLVRSPARPFARSPDGTTDRRPQ
jgi:hypothetical protein